MAKRVLQKYKKQTWDWGWRFSFTTKLCQHFNLRLPSLSQNTISLYFQMRKNIEVLVPIPEFLKPECCSPSDC